MQNAVSEGGKLEPKNHHRQGCSGARGHRSAGAFFLNAPQDMAAEMCRLLLSFFTASTSNLCRRCREKNDVKRPITEMAAGTPDRGRRRWHRRRIDEPEDAQSSRQEQGSAGCAVGLPL